MTASSLILSRLGWLTLLLGLGSLAGCGSDAGADPEVMAGAAGMSSPSAGSAGTSTASAGAASAGGSNAGSAGSTVGGAHSAGSGGSAAGSGGSVGSSAGASGSAGSAGVAGSGVDPNGGAPGGPSSTRQIARPSGSITGTKQGFLEYVPPHYGNGTRYPLMVFWHGIGENGDGSAMSILKVANNGPPRVVKDDEWPEDRKFVVLSPQHPGTDCPSSAEIDAFILFALTHYDVDLTRVYLTGLSCGAIGSWNYLGDHLDEVVAAAVLVSGDGRGAVAKAGCALGRLPIWAFHGDKDPTVDPKGSIDTLHLIQACKNPAPIDAKLTVYPGVAHDAWTRTFDLSAGNNVYAWLLTHHK